MGRVTTHVLDTAAGRPREGVEVLLERDGTEVARGTTDADGRITDLPADLAPGTYSLRFGTAGVSDFFPEVVVTFVLGEGHHHVPLLLSPFGYTTYRGS